MMGRSHALTGWCAGLAAAPVLGQHDMAGTLVIASVTAGFALLPDLDHRSSTASRLLGPITGALSWVVRRSGSVIYNATKGPRDEPASEHRTWWHTALAAVLLGVATTAGISAGGRWAVLVVGLIGLLLAAAALGDWILLPAAVAAVLILADCHGDLGMLGARMDSRDIQLGCAVALGCLVHDLGDALTRSGCPVLFPILIAGETYYEIRPPRILRFRTGGPTETALFYVAFVPAAIVLFPGVWPHLWPVLLELARQKPARG
jgi:hypothetical protein